jgi:hypothetical protein
MVCLQWPSWIPTPWQQRRQQQRQQCLRQQQQQEGALSPQVPLLAALQRQAHLVACMHWLQLLQQHQVLALVALACQDLLLSGLRVQQILLLLLQA